MNEVSLYSRLEDAATREGWLLTRVQDAAGKAPFDMVGVLGGLGVAIEVKVWRGALGFDPRRLGTWPQSWWTRRRHQLGWLRDWATSGGVALVMVFDSLALTWGMIVLPPGLVGDLRTLPLDRCRTVGLGRELIGWKGEIERQSLRG